MAWLSLMSKVLSLPVYPITYLASFAYGVLRFLVNLLIGLARYPLRLVLLPFRVLVYFEAILIFITAAVFIGFVLGILLHSTTELTVEWFNKWMDYVFLTLSPTRLVYEKAQRPQFGAEAKKSGRLLQPGEFFPKMTKYSGPRGASGHSASTIMEEDDESSSAYFED